MPDDFAKALRHLIDGSDASPGSIQTQLLYAAASVAQRESEAAGDDERLAAQCAAESEIIDAAADLVGNMTAEQLDATIARMRAAFASVKGEPTNAH